MNQPISALSLLAEYGIRVVDKHRYPDVGETRAVATVERILKRRGLAHTRMMLATLAETANKGLSYDEAGFWSASDIVLLCAPLIERDATAWLDFFDRVPLGELQAVASRMRGVTPQRFALDGMIYERVERIFGKDANQLDLLDDRREL